MKRGDWNKWVDENCGLPKTTAWRCTKLASAVVNVPALEQMPFKKACTLMELPEDEYKSFIEGQYDVNGTEKSVYEMSTRELDDTVQAYKKKKKAQKEDETPAECTIFGNPDGDEALDSLGEQDTVITVVDCKKTFHENFRFVQSSVDGMLDYIEQSRNNDPDTYADLCTALQRMCDHIMSKISTEERRKIS